jgi:hypothetical protein
MTAMGAQQTNASKNPSPNQLSETTREKMVNITKATQRAKIEEGKYFSRCLEIQ